jgi:hypothetical protein
MDRQIQIDEKVLNMPVQIANHRLTIKAILEFSKRLGSNKCYRCDYEILEEKDLSIEHKLPYGRSISRKQDKVMPERFFDPDNLVLSHKRCNSGFAGVRVDGSSKFIGVRRFIDNRNGKDYQKWCAYRGINGKITYFGYYDDEIIAAEASDLGIVKHFDGAGLLNFPEKLEHYRQKIKEGWGEKPKCKTCGKKHFGLGYCKYHWYHLGPGKQKRREQYLKNEQAKYV